MPANAVPGFQPSRHGFRFANAWPSQPDLAIRLPLVGSVKVGDAADGLCGGMVYAVRDYYEAGVSPPPGPMPEAGTLLYRYIVTRLFDSFDLPRGALTYYAWMNLPNGDQLVRGRPIHGVAWRTVIRQWPRVRADIDAGHPSPLGLITVRSVNPRDLAKCHQALAYAYDLTGSMVTLRVYDPNTDPDGADNCVLVMDIGHPDQRTSTRHNLAIPHPIRGFFRTSYAPEVPPADA